MLTLFAGQTRIALKPIAESLARRLDGRVRRRVVRIVDAARGDSLKPVALSREIHQLASLHEVVILAMRGPFLQDVLTAFDASDFAVILTNGSPRSVRATQRILALTASLGLGVDRVGVALVHGGADAMDATQLAEVLHRAPLTSTALGAPDDQGALAAREFAERLWHIPAAER